METMVNIFLYGKKYQVPSNLTIMCAMEYAGYQLVRGCGCRNGFCGACATIYRIKGDRELKVCLACQTKVEDNMYIATLPFFPLVKQVYDMNEIKPTEQIMMQLYPEIYACIGCNACTKACTQGLNVMQYIAYAQRGEYEKCAEESFDCVMCGGYGIGLSPDVYDHHSAPVYFVRKGYIKVGLFARNSPLLMVEYRGAP